MAEDDPRALQWQQDPVALDRENFNVVIVGRRLQRHVAGIRLKQRASPSSSSRRIHRGRHLVREPVSRLRRGNR